MSNKNYIHPAQKRQDEHEKKKNKKKKKRSLLWLLLLLLLLLGIGLGLGLGLGWFDGKGDGDGDGDTKSVVQADGSQADSKEDVSEATEKTAVKVKIAGDKYIYEDAELTLEDLKTKLSALDKTTTIIEVTDENAVANAVTSLKEMLESVGLSFTGIN